MSGNPRNYPDTILSAESGRPMVRGEERVTLKDGDHSFSYLQPGWWCSLTDQDDMEGQFVDEDNVVARQARSAMKCMKRGAKFLKELAKK